MAAKSECTLWRIQGIHRKFTTTFAACTPQSCICASLTVGMSECVNAVNGITRDALDMHYYPAVVSNNSSAISTCCNCWWLSRYLPVLGAASRRCVSTMCPSILHTVCTRYFERPKPGSNPDTSIGARRAILCRYLASVTEQVTQKRTSRQESASTTPTKESQKRADLQNPSSTQLGWLF